MALKIEDNKKIDLTCNTCKEVWFSGAWKDAEGKSNICCGVELVVQRCVLCQELHKGVKVSPDCAICGRCNDRCTPFFTNGTERRVDDDFYDRMCASVIFAVWKKLGDMEKKIDDLTERVDNMPPVQGQYYHSAASHFSEEETKQKEI